LRASEKYKGRAALQRERKDFTTKTFVAEREGLIFYYQV
jgi:hypothetical protein